MVVESTTTMLERSTEPVSTPTVIVVAGQFAVALAAVVKPVPLTVIWGVVAWIE
jgi:hypothetical protein